MPIPKNFNPMKKPKDTLPEKMWQLLEVAIADVKSVFASKNVTINFEAWADHPDPEKPQCTVCLGGSVLLGTVCKSDIPIGHMDLYKLEDNEQISQHDVSAISALDSIRCGDYDEAFDLLYVDTPEEIPEAKYVQFDGKIKTKAQQKKFLNHLNYLKNLYKKADV